MAGISITEKEQCLRSPGGEVRAECGIAQAPEMMGAGITGGIGYKFALVALQQIDVPGESFLKLWIAAGFNAEFPEIKDAEFNRGMPAQPAKPRTVVLRGMR